MPTRSLPFGPIALGCSSRLPNAARVGISRRVVGPIPPCTSRLKDLPRRVEEEARPVVTASYVTACSRVYPGGSIVGIDRACVALGTAERLRPRSTFHQEWPPRDERAN